MKYLQRFKIDLNDVDAFIFDTDGVITDTASVHAAAWKQLFDEYLKKVADRNNEKFQPFDINSDYLLYVDGKPRYDGAKSFLESRGIILPYGAPEDDIDQETVCGLGNRKNRYFRKHLQNQGGKPYASSVRFIKKIKSRGIATAVISSSRNAEEVLIAAGVRELFSIKVDGKDSAERKLKGKPHPDIFLEAARQLGVQPQRTAVVEDALSGVEAGYRGKFKLVIGVDRAGQAELLKSRGADIVVEDLSQLNIGNLKPDRRQKKKGTTQGARLTTGMERVIFQRPHRKEPIKEEEASGDAWLLSYQDFQPEQEGLREALCTLGNGYFATRGAAPESNADGIHYPGTFIAGCYNRLKTIILGKTIENESLINAPNWLTLVFRIENDDWFDLQRVKLLDFRQELDLCRGILSRFILFEDKDGRVTRVQQRRFVSMAEPNLAGLETTFTAENWSGILHVISALDGRVVNNGVKRYQQLNNQHLEPVITQSIDRETILLKVETNQSHIGIAEAARTRIFCGDEQNGLEPHVKVDPNYISQEYSIPLKKGKSVTVEKVVALVTSRDHAISEIGIEAQKKVLRAENFTHLLDQHSLRWDHLWQRCKIAITDNDRTSLILNLHIFHLLQTVSPNTIDIDTGVPARGLHGEAYHGHIFWDELFIFPFLNLRIPDITRSLLMYRYRRLSEARRAAEVAGYKGAMYPWQSGSDGREETQTLHLNPRSRRWIPDKSHRQRHINIAIAYNVWLYYQVSGDIDFLSFYGAEIIIEIARFWASIATYNPSLDKYEIRKIMGPDEYHDGYPDTEEPGLDNNAYTNVMAVWVLCRALELMDIVPDDRRMNLCDNLGITQEELESWDNISRKMRIIFHDDGIISQFEGYNKLQEFDWQGYSKKYGNIQRLDRILEAEGDTTNRYKLSKQADVLMLFYLLSAEELQELFERLGYPIERDTIRKNIEYYINRTSHGSTLSRIVHSWVLARSDRDLSWNLFKKALESDISDIQGGTTNEGIHLGAMAGTVDCIQRCYTGIETRGDRLWFNPRLPRDLKNISFNIIYRRNWVNVQIDSKRLKISTRHYSTAPINIGFRDRLMQLSPGDSVELQI